MRRAVITGIGVVSPIALDSESFYQALLQGDAVFLPENEGYDGHGNTQLSCRISPRDQANIIESLGSEIIYKGEGARFGVHAALQAVRDSCISLNEELIGYVPVYMGNSEGEASLLSQSLVTEETLIDFESDVIPRRISERLGLTGPVAVFHNTCASANMALDAAVQDIQNGHCLVTLCGASDPFSLKVLAGFNSLKALSPNGCKPFASDRKGIVISEGAFVFVVEEAEFAKARKAKIYAEILGVGISNDASHLTNPNAAGIKIAIERAMKDANIKPIDIDVIFAHATGTVANDKTEAAVLGEIFGIKSIPPVSAIKATVGHMMAAAGAANIAAACLSFKYGKIPPSKRSEPIDSTLAINLVRNNPISLPGGTALVNAFGFGGNNAVVILRSLKT